MSGYTDYSRSIGYPGYSHYPFNNNNNNNNNLSEVSPKRDEYVHDNSTSTSNNSNDFILTPSKVTRATGPSLPPKNDKTNHTSILSAVYLFHYFQDTEAPKRILQNYEWWNQNKSIMQLLTKPELFATYCFNHFGISDPKEIINDKNRLSDFEILRSVIAESILMGRNFKIYVVNDGYASYLEKEPQAQPYILNDIADKPNRRPIIDPSNMQLDLLERICDIARVNFRTSKEERTVREIDYDKSYVLGGHCYRNEKREIDVWNFENKNDSASLQELGPVPNPKLETGPNIQVLNSRGKESILSLRNKIKYDETDADAEDRILRNFALWNENKDIFKLLTEPELFATLCFRLSGISDPKIIKELSDWLVLKKTHTEMSDAFKWGDFETLRSIIAEEILTGENQGFKLYKLKEGDSSFLLKQPTNGCFDMSYFHGDYDRKIWRASNINGNLLEKICEILGIHFKITNEKHPVYKIHNYFARELIDTTQECEVEVWNFD